jgi:hypothetical protein
MAGAGEARRRDRPRVIATSCGEDIARRLSVTCRRAEGPATRSTAAARAPCLVDATPPWLGEAARLRARSRAGALAGTALSTRIVTRDGAVVKALEVLPLGVLPLRRRRCGRVALTSQARAGVSRRGQKRFGPRAQPGPLLRRRHARATTDRLAVYPSSRWMREIVLGGGSAAAADGRRRDRHASCRLGPVERVVGASKRDGVVLGVAPRARRSEGCSPAGSDRG